MDCNGLVGFLCEIHAKYLNMAGAMVANPTKMMGAASRRWEFDNGFRREVVNNILMDAGVYMGFAALGRTVRGLRDALSHVDIGNGQVVREMMDGVQKKLSTAATTKDGKVLVTPSGKVLHKDGSVMDGASASSMQGSATATGATPNVALGRVNKRGKVEAIEIEPVAPSRKGEERWSISINGKVAKSRKSMSKAKVQEWIGKNVSEPEVRNVTNAELATDFNKSISEMSIADQAAVRSGLGADIGITEGASPRVVGRYGGGVMASSVGDFGERFMQFHNKPEEAIEHLIRERRGEAVGAIQSNVVAGVTGNPSIDLVWGKVGRGATDKGGFGLAHIIKKHGKKAARDIPRILREGEISSDPRLTNSSRVTIVDKSKRVGVRLDWDGKGKQWVVTAFDDTVAPLNTSTPSAANSAISGDPFGRNASGVPIDSNIAQGVSEGNLGGIVALVDNDGMARILRTVGIDDVRATLNTPDLVQRTKTTFSVTKRTDNGVVRLKGKLNQGKGVASVTDAEVLTQSKWEARRKLGGVVENNIKRNAENKPPAGTLGAARREVNSIE